MHHCQTLLEALALGEQAQEHGGELGMEGTEDLEYSGCRLGSNVI